MQMNIISYEILNGRNFESEITQISWKTNINKTL